MSVSFIIIGGVLVFVIGIVIGIASGQKDNNLVVDKIDSSFRYEFTNFESSLKWRMENMNNTLNSLSKTVYALDASNMEKNKNIQLDRVVKIIAEELKKT